MDHDGGVEQGAEPAQRRAHDQHRKQRARGFDDRRDAALDRIEQRVLKQQVVDRVGRKAELRKQHQRRLAGIALGGEP